MLGIYLIFIMLADDPSVRIDGSISLGSILTIATLLGIALFFHREWIELKYEHRLMFAEYCIRMGIELPPHHRKALAKAAGR
jgi:hypothetical protein